MLKLEEETLDGTVWKTRFERGYGPVVRQTTLVVVVVMAVYTTRLSTAQTKKCPVIGWK